MYLTYKAKDKDLDLRKEELHQIDCTSFVSVWYPDLVYFHVANETGSKGAVQFVMKRRSMGVKKGVADIIILSPTITGYPHSVVELKKPFKPSTLSRDQKEFLINASRSGGLSAVCYGHMAFREFLLEHYGEKRPL